MSDEYASILRRHIRDTNRRLGVLENKFERHSRKIETIFQRLKDIENNYVRMGDIVNMEDVDDHDQRQVVD